MKKRDNHSILTIIKKTLQQKQKHFIVMSFLLVVIMGYFLWNLDKIQTENVEIREAVYQLEKDNFNEQISVVKICLASDKESREEYEELSDSYDMKIQSQIKILRQAMPEEEENLNTIQKILQSAWQDRQFAIMNAGLKEDREKALNILEQDYSPKMQEIADICTALSQSVSAEGARQLQLMKLTMAGVIIILAGTVIFEIIVSGKQKEKIKRLINIPVQEIIVAMEELEKGNLMYESSYQSENEMGILMESIRRTTRILRGYITHIEQTLKLLSEKEYNIENNYLYSGDFVRISDAMNTIICELNGTMGGISEDIEIVRNAGYQVEKLAVVLAKDTMENASSIEELSTSVEEVVEQVKGNLEKMKEINSAEKEITGWAENCCERTENLQQVMGNTVDSTKRLETLMNDMEEISEEINLLSLNASIEAAKAGNGGSGFAVVAEEIRKLSGQTAAATEKAKQYISNCTNSAMSGRFEVQQTKAQVSMITEQMIKIRNMVETASEVSEVQLKEMQNFKNGIEDMSIIVQNDSHIAIHLEGHANSLKMCVEEIAEEMKEFKINFEKENVK